MQYIFIKNIKNLLQEGSSGADGKKRIDLQIGFMLLHNTLSRIMDGFSLTAKTESPIQ